MAKKPLPKDAREALNFEGVFLKKRVLGEIRKVDGMRVFAEEFGATFNEPVAIDAIAFDSREKVSLLFVLECKKAYVKEKKWVFFRDTDRRFRRCRFVSSVGNQCGSYAEGNSPSGPTVCSEGYELTETSEGHQANQDPIYRAAIQLCKGFLGFVRTRCEQKNPSDWSNNRIDCIVPVLVTTAELCVAEFDVTQICLASGNLSGELRLTSQDSLILKQPFSEIPDKTMGDFRKVPTGGDDMNRWEQQYRESLWVVNSAKLINFFDKRFRDELAAV